MNIDFNTCAHTHTIPCTHVCTYTHAYTNIQSLGHTSAYSCNYKYILWCIHIYFYTHAYTHANMCVSTHANLHIHTCTLFHSDKYSHMHTLAYTHPCISMCAYTHSCACAHTHKQIWKKSICLERDFFSFLFFSSYKIDWQKIMSAFPFFLFKNWLLVAILSWKQIYNDHNIKDKKISFFFHHASWMKEAATFRIIFLKFWRFYKHSNVDYSQCFSKKQSRVLNTKLHCRHTKKNS